MTSLVLHRLAVASTPVVAAASGALLFLAVAPALAVHHHRTRRTHR
ncbi:unannotated protein [freshwater metagenome]|uniref:Unannotated protein n=1 Tax=freshwater metagenome TaxID=449393 RepID=A0A6J7FRE2_9ZZZZ|nr:hypothetical protein [Actinomycetota bacterium]